jgi:tetratricopeptide (TPR) repeat protein
MQGGTASSTGVFVGREHDLRSLEAVLDDARLGRGRVVLISGEAGIGKTRLSEEAGHLAVERGFRLVRASCFLDEGAPPFWLWIQILRALVDKSGPDVEAVLGPRRTEVARLMPELTRPGDPEFVMDASARFRLLDALAGSLRSFSEPQPLLIVLDDLHWADAASLQMLRHCAREIRDAPIVVIGAYRDTEFGGALGDVIADLRRVSDGISLSGLTPEDVGRLIAPWTSDSPRLVRVVTQETGGNPFFVKEVVRLLAAQGRLDEDIDLSSLPVLPETVRDVIDHHLSRLSQPCHDALELAAVLGHEFAVAILSEVSDVPVDRLLDLIGEAVSARVLNEVPDGPATFRFSHALVREAVYEGLGPVRSRRLHQRIGDALERAYRGRDELAATLAHHFLRAAPLTPSDKAVSYSLRAGELAARSVAYEQAARHFSDALRALDLGVPDPRRRCELLVALGDARWRAGEVDTARTIFVEAARAAKAARDSMLFARAALGYGEGVGGQGLTFQADETLIRLLEDALRARDVDDAMRARLMARLAVQCFWTNDPDRGVRLSTEAVEIAERLDDPRLLLETVYSLDARRLSSAADVTRADEIVAAATERQDLELLFWAYQYRLTILAELRDIPAVDADINACSRIAEELRMPRYRWQVMSWRFGRALMRADLSHADRLADESFRLCEQFESGPALFVYGAQLGVLRWLQGRFDELEPMLASYAEQYPWIPGYSAGLALMYAEAGRLPESRAALERLAAGGFAVLRENPAERMSQWMLAVPARVLDDPSAAALLAKGLDVYADTNITMAGIVLDLGSARLPMGLYAAAQGDMDRALEELERAAGNNAETGNEVMRLIASRETASVLIARGRPGDIDRAAELLKQVRERIDVLGLHGLAPRTAALERAASSESGGTDALRRDGEDFWTATYRGKTVRVRDVKGLGDIAYLLAAPGRELHVSELVALAEGSDPDAVAAVLNRPADELIDAQARDAYRRRIAELQLELDDARQAADLVRAERAKDDLDALTGELASAYGLGGRPRSSSSDAERARKAVGWRIRDAIRRIDAVHPDLAAHLRGSLQLGMFCSYQPGSHPGWTVSA